jgi:dihydropteroate synthase
MQPACAFTQESFSDGQRVVAVDRLPARIALAQANDATVVQVDGGKEV